MEGSKKIFTNEMYHFDLEVKGTKNVGKQFDSIIYAFKKIYLTGRTITCTDFSYNHIKNFLTNLIIDNSLHTEDEWQLIKNNFVVKIGQVFDKENLNSLIVNLELLKQKYLVKEKEDTSIINIYNILHPRIQTASKNSFFAGCYADAVESACKSINERLKKIYKQEKNSILDGDSLFTNTFSPNNPVIKIDKDLTSLSGKNVQKGYMLIFQGMWAAIRDPKAHANIVISKTEALHKLFLLSLLMYKIDEGIKISNIYE